MRPADYLLFCSQSIRGFRFRSVMVLIAIAFGVTAVLALTALGDGAKNYVLKEFAFLGKDVLVMFPGRNETTGGLPPVMGAAARNITLSDVDILQRRVSAISELAPLVIGSAEVSHDQLSREVIILGTSDAFISLRQMSLSRGRNLIIDDITRATDECLIGETLQAELLPRQNPIGSMLRVADYRCRVVGVIAGRGDAFGMNMSDALVLSVAAAQRLFNVQGLFRVLIKIRPGYELEAVKQQITQTITQLHQGENDVTLVSPDAMLSTFNDIFTVMTLAVAAIGSISLLVSGVLIMNITVISISQRTQEIGLLKALGAHSQVVQRLFVFEAVLLTTAGALIGLIVGQLVVMLGRSFLPDVAMSTPVWATVSSVLVAVGCGLLFSWIPSRRASALRPLEALQKR